MSPRRPRTTPDGATLRGERIQVAPARCVDRAVRLDANDRTRGYATIYGQVERVVFDSKAGIWRVET